MARPAIPQLTKVRSVLQKEIGSKCPFCPSEEVGHFQIHHIDESPENNDPLNLLLVCPTCHSKITKREISPMDVLRRKLNLQAKPPKATPSLSSIIQKGNNNSIINGDGNKVIINAKSVKSGPKTTYVPGMIGYDPAKKNYVDYLIKRYLEFKEHEVGKGQLRPAIIFKTIKREFKVGSTQTIFHLSESMFDRLASYLQDRIKGTRLGRMKAGQQSVFEPYDQYKASLGQ